MASFLPALLDLLRTRSAIASFSTVALFGAPASALAGSGSAWHETFTVL